MDTILNDVDFSIAYLNNILIKSESCEHAKHVKEVFEKNKTIWLETLEIKVNFFYLKVFGTGYRCKRQKTRLIKVKYNKEHASPNKCVGTISILRSRKLLW